MEEIILNNTEREKMDKNTVSSKRIAYKGFDVDGNNNLYCQHGEYPRKYYKLDEIASIDGKLALCRNGIHFCWNINDVNGFYNIRNKVICKVEILGDVINQSDMKKSCTDKLRILEILTKEQVFSISNSGTMNSGVANSGDCNSGDHNSGNHNSGDCNSGYYNSGYWNSGYCNSGDCNSGDHNSGNHNSGNHNSGDCNSGYGNSGNHNSGYFNTCNFSNGIFCTESPGISFFNIPTEITRKELENLGYLEVLHSTPFNLTEWIPYSKDEMSKDKAKQINKGYLKEYSHKETYRKWWDSKRDRDKDIIKSFPHFNAEIFYEITGIRV